MKKLILAIAASLSITTAVFAQPKMMKIATIAPARSAWDLASKKLAADWAKATNGQLNVQYMNANAMGGEAGVIQKLNAIRPGQKAPIDGGIFTSMGISMLFPESNILTMDIPFMFESSEEVDYVVEKISSKVDSIMAKKGYKFLGLYNVGWCYFYTKSPVRTPKQLKSLKLYVDSGSDAGLITNAFKASGYKTEYIQPGKLLANLRTPGGVEGFYTIPMYAYAGQFSKSAPYILNLPLFPTLAALVVSKSSWDAIPESQKPALLAAVKVARDEFTKAQKTSDSEYIKKAVEDGCTLATLTPEEIQMWKDEMEKDSPVMIKSGLADKTFYDEIQVILKEYRGAKK